MPPQEPVARRGAIDSNGRLLPMPDLDAMLEAHVQFELDRWTPEQLSPWVGDQVGALLGWLDSVALADVVPTELVGDWVRDYVLAAPITDESVELIAGVARSAHSAALEDGTAVRDVLPYEVYQQFADAVIGMKEVRRAITNEVTTSEVYSKLISHVLYQGIKNYLMTESVIARKVPGASSLMRLGQNALNSAAPNLEKSIDKQLTAFVNANIQDSIRESRHYLDKVLDDQLLGTVTEEVWNNNADLTIADAAALVSPEALDLLTAASQTAWLYLRDTPSVADITTTVITEFLEANGDRSVTDILTDIGVSADLVTDQIVQAIEPAVTRAREDGFLEVRIRAWLGEFYADYATRIV
ncbi:MAG: hypothetical protein WCI74_04945 [Actinomycetes bacterium]